MINEDTNFIKLTGYSAARPVLSHEIYGERFYTFVLCARRQSGTYDCISVTFSQKLMDNEKIFEGVSLMVMGQIRTYNVSKPGHNRVSVTVFAKNIEFCEDIRRDDINEIELEGYVCKEVSLRTTPLGREICDLLLAVNRRFNKADYIPVIVWGRNARFASNMKKGQRIKIIGRLQSRTYKKIVEDQEELRTAFEVSAVSINEI